MATYFLAKVSKKIVNTSSPFSLSIEPTTACNLSCPECPSGLKQFYRPTGNLALNYYKQYLKHIQEHVAYINFYFQGEPFINKSCIDFIEQAKSHKIYCSTSTNAHFITPDLADKIVKSGLDRLIVSIDGITQETYQNYRIGGNLNTALKGLNNVIDAKNKYTSKTPHIIFQFLVVKPNEHEISEARRLAKTLGVDEIRFKTAQIYDYKNGNPLIPDNIKYSRYKRQKDGTYRIKNKLLNHCWRMWSSAVITWDGRVVPCCFDKHASYNMGQISDGIKLHDIWKSSQYNSFRQQVFTSRQSIDICKNCTEGSKVWD